MLKLSIIVPVLNEVDALADFVPMLLDQQGIDFELVLVDGGSDDGTPEFIEKRVPTPARPVRIVRSGKGRARQLNRGVASSVGELLLFLHVDSMLANRDDLKRSVELFDRRLRTCGHDRIAGHFRLKFAAPSDDHRFGYYFWECKARLNRPECTHGDQGFLLKRSFFDAVGPFDEDAPIAEDTRLAERIRAAGQWVLLPAELWTSVRRFEREGLVERQTLNALIMNFAAIGWEEFFRQARDIYRDHSRAGKIELYRFLCLIDQLNASSGLLTRWKRWYGTGRYVRRNAWQLAFLRDVRRSYKTGVPADDVRHACLDFHDAWFESLTDNIPGRLVATVGTWIWFRRMVRKYRERDSGPVSNTASLL